MLRNFTSLKATRKIESIRYGFRPGAQSSLTVIGKTLIPSTVRSRKPSFCQGLPATASALIFSALHLPRKPDSASLSTAKHQPVFGGYPECFGGQIRLHYVCRSTFRWLSCDSQEK